MTSTQEKLIRALVAAQVAVFEWGEEWGNGHVSDTYPAPVNNTSIVLAALDACLKEATKQAKQLRKDSDE